MISAVEARKIVAEASDWSRDHSEIFGSYQSETDKVSFFVSFLQQVIPHNITSSAGQGKSRLFMEPFASVPGVYHPRVIEDKVMGEIAEWLTQHEYHVEYDRRDDRMVLIVTW